MIKSMSRDRQKEPMWSFQVILTKFSSPHISSLNPHQKYLHRYRFLPLSTVILLFLCNHPFNDASPYTPNNHFMGQGRKGCLCSNHYCCCTAAPGYRDWVFRPHCVCKDKADTLFPFIYESRFPSNLLNWRNTRAGTDIYFQCVCEGLKRCGERGNNTVVFPSGRDKCAKRKPRCKRAAEWWVEGLFFTWIWIYERCEILVSLLE